MKCSPAVGGCHRPRLTGVDSLVAGYILSSRALFPGNIRGERNLTAGGEGGFKFAGEGQGQAGLAALEQFQDAAGKRFGDMDGRARFGPFGTLDQRLDLCCSRCITRHGVAQQKHFCPAAGILPAIQSCRKHPGIVHHQHILVADVVADIAEAVVADTAVHGVKDQQAGQVTSVRRFLGNVLVGQVIGVGLEAEILIHWARVVS